MIIYDLINMCHQHQNFTVINYHQHHNHQHYH